MSFLGPFQATLDNKPAVFATDRARALLAYLAVEAGRPHRRETLAGLLWPDRPEAAARRNLSQTLVRLRRAIDDYHAAPPFLQITGKTIQFKAALVELDVTCFQTLLAACAADPHEDPANCPACIERLQEAAGLYRGEFLKGLFLADSQPFEEWALFRREQLHRQALDALHALTGHYEGQGAYDQAQRYAERQLTLEPWREEAHRQLMQALALGGQHSAALGQYQTCRRLLAEELAAEPAQETVTLYEQIRDGKMSRGAGGQGSGGEISVAAQPANLRHNLPLTATPFVGREVELAELARLLADPEVRLLTILGPGGVGKSRLALEAAQAQLDSLAHGVRFVPLAAIDPADFAGAIDPLLATTADALNFAYHGGETPRDQLLAYLQEKEMLLVFDNFEHLLETAEVVSDLVRYAPRLKVLVTSRERLNLREEWLFALQGMPVPAEGAPTSEAANYGAVQLFWQHARRLQSGFDPSTEQAWVVRICQLVGGLPLGIELAAAWVRLMPCRVIVQEIERGIDFLATSLRNVPERHRSLRAVFDQSWCLLSEAERAILGKLSVFRGGFQREAAEATAGASLRQLAGLVDKSLLQVTPSGRYEIHEHLRQYAAEKLYQTPGEYEQTRGMHCLIYLDLLRQQEKRLKGARLKAAQEAITADIDNVRAAWRWAVERDRQAEIKDALESLWIYYEVQGWFLEGEDAFGLTAAKLRPHGDSLEPAKHTSKGTASPAESCVLLGQVLTRQAWFQLRLGHLKQAESVLQECLSLLRWEERDARRETALALSFLGVSMHFRHDHVKAIDLLQESVALFKMCGDLWGEALAQIVLGQIALALGQYAEAERFSQESITIYNHIGERRIVAYAKATLGRVAAARGQYRQAKAIYSEILDIRTEFGDRAGVAFALKDLGEVARLQGKPGQAKGYYQQSIALAKEIGLPQATAQSLWGLGSLAEGLGDYAAAKGFFRESMAISKGTGRRGQVSLTLAGPGWAALGLAEYQEAEQYFHQTLQLTAETRNVLLALDALAGQAYLLAHTGEPERALEFLTLILRHPAAAQETKDRAASLGAELAAELSPEAVAAAQARGKERTLEGVVAEVLGQEDGFELAEPSLPLERVGAEDS